MENQNPIQETVPQTPLESNQIPSQLPKHTSPSKILIILGIFLLLVFIGSCIYFLRIQKNNSSLQKQNNSLAMVKSKNTIITTPSIKIAPTNTTTSNWQQFSSKSCGITIKYPPDWTFTDDQFRPDGENGTNECFEIDATTQDGVLQGVIRVEKLHLGIVTVFGKKGLEKVNIQTIDDFIQVLNVFTPTSSLQNKTYGNLSGKQFYVTTGQYNYTNFVFIQNGSLYNVWWDRYGYKNDFSEFTSSENALIPSIISSITLQ